MSRDNKQGQEGRPGTSEWNSSFQCPFFLHDNERSSTRPLHLTSSLLLTDCDWRRTCWRESQQSCCLPVWKETEFGHNTFSVHLWFQLKPKYMSQNDSRKYLRGVLLNIFKLFSLKYIYRKRMVMLLYITFLKMHFRCIVDIITCYSEMMWPAFTYLYAYYNAFWSFVSVSLLLVCASHVLPWVTMSQSSASTHHTTKSTLYL